MVGVGGRKAGASQVEWEPRVVWEGGFGHKLSAETSLEP